MPQPRSSPLIRHARGTAAKSRYPFTTHATVAEVWNTEEAFRAASAAALIDQSPPA